MHRNGMALGKGTVLRSLSIDSLQECRLDKKALTEGLQMEFLLRPTYVSPSYRHTGFVNGRSAGWWLTFQVLWDSALTVCSVRISLAK